MASGLNYDATLRNLELIGEAANQIPEAIRTTMPQIQWRQMIAVRNRVADGYLGLDNDTLWSIICTDVPALIVELEKFRAAYQLIAALKFQHAVLVGDTHGLQRSHYSESADSFGQTDGSRDAHCGA